MLASMLVNAAGASEIFKEGYITYSNEAKSRLLGVDAQALERYGAVSETVARQMAEGAAAAAGATAALSVTGIAARAGERRRSRWGLSISAVIWMEPPRRRGICFTVPVLRFERLPHAGRLSCSLHVWRN